MTNSKNNNQNQQQKSVNQFVDFFPGFKLEKEKFDKALLSPTEEYDSKTKKRTMVRKSFPYTRSINERVYDRFITDVVDPTTNEFYPPRDELGNPIEMPDNGPNCRHVIHTIIRIRLYDGSEKLYTLGQIIGFDSFGMKRTINADFLETYTNTIFGYDRKVDSSGKRIITYTTGPMTSERAYTLDFSAENVDMLVQKADNGKNPFFKTNKHGNTRKVTLIVKDTAGGTAIEVFWSTWERSLELFKTKSFAELFNGSYLPLAVRQESKAFSAGLTESLTGEKVNQPTPKVEDTSNNTANNYNNSKDYSQYK